MYCIKKATKHFLIHQINDENLVLMKFSKVKADSQLEWEHPEEFEYKGQMYDVIKTHSDVDSVSYLCYHDVPESKISIKIAHLINSAQNNDPNNQQAQQRIFDFLKNCYCIEYAEYQPISSDHQKSTFAFLLLSTISSSKKTGHPPQVAGI